MSLKGQDKTQKNVMAVTLHFFKNCVTLTSSLSRQVLGEVVNCNTEKRFVCCNVWSQLWFTCHCLLIVIVIIIIIEWIFEGYPLLMTCSV